MKGRVPVEPFREAFERSDMSATEVALRAGWTSRGRPEGGRVTRHLGLRPYRCRDRWLLVELLAPPTAERLCRALDLDPVDVGL